LTAVADRRRASECDRSAHSALVIRAMFCGSPRSPRSAQLTREALAALETATAGSEKIAHGVGHLRCYPFALSLCREKPTANNSTEASLGNAQLLREFVLRDVKFEEDQFEFLVHGGRRRQRLF